MQKTEKPETTEKTAVRLSNGKGGGNQVSLPNEYTKLEYIESTGTQYIDTGFAPNQDTRCVCDISINDISGLSNIIPYGSRTNASTYYYPIVATGKWAYAFGSKVATGNVNTSGRVLLDSNKNTLYANSDAVVVENNLFSGSHPIFLFALNDAGKAFGHASYKLYSCQIYNNDVLVRDFVPAVRADGTVGLLDKQNDVFYENAGSGTFIAGPVVEPEPEEPDEPTEPEKPTGPVVPNGFECFGATMKVAVLGWGASNGAQTYKLRRDDAVIYQGEEVCYTDAGLEPGRVYAYTVASVFEGVESEEVPLEVETKTEMWLINDRTVRDLVVRNQKAFYDAIDMIRVGEAMEYLEGRLYDVGISIFVSPRLDLSLTDTPSFAQLSHYLADVRAVQAKLNEFRASVSSPESMTGFGFEGANNIETILLNTEQLIIDIIRSYRLLCGRTISGVNVLP